MNNKNKHKALLQGLIELYSEFRKETTMDAELTFDNFMYFALNKYTVMSDEITGYYVDLPAGAQSIGVNGGEETPLANYTDGMVTPETENTYGLVEWDAEVEIESVTINNEPVDVQPILSGSHPHSKPK